MMVTPGAPGGCDLTQNNDRHNDVIAPSDFIIEPRQTAIVHCPLKLWSEYLYIANIETEEVKKMGLDINIANVGVISPSLVFRDT